MEFLIIVGPRVNFYCHKKLQINLENGNNQLVRQVLKLLRMDYFRRILTIAYLKCQARRCGRKQTLRVQCKRNGYHSHSVYKREYNLLEHIESILKVNCSASDIVHQADHIIQQIERERLFNI